MVTSLPALGTALVVMTLLAAGPLQALDRAGDHPWARWALPGLRPLLVEVVDRIAGREVALPVLAVAAVVLAWRVGTRRPLWISAAAVVVDKALIATMKVVIARPAPVTGDPAFFHGGLWESGVTGVVYPSGHAADAVVIYGLIAYLIARYTRVGTRTVTLLIAGVAAVTMLTMATSLALRFHWVTDLLAGALAGGLVLRLTTRIDDLIPARARRASAREYTINTGSAVGKQPERAPSGAARG